MEFRILGPLEVVVDGRALPLGGPKQRAVLAMLLLDVNRVVSTARLIDGVWGERAADRAAGTLQVYVSALRRVLEPVKGEHRILLARPPGYVLLAEPDSVDALDFDRRVTAGRKDLVDERYDSAAEQLGAALRLWRGEPLADFAFDDFASADIARLGAARLAAVEDRIEAELACGRHVELVAELEGLVAANPSRERLWGQLMLALYRSGRQSDALAVFGRARHRMVEELGLDPGPDLRELERQILAQEPGLAAPRGSVRSPVKLPLPSHPVVGRDTDVAAVLGRLADPEVRLVSLVGPGGIGKTSLALEVAGRLVTLRPGGVYFVALADVEDAGQIVASIAATLEVDRGPDDSPTEAIALSLNSRPTLLVLDNLEQIAASGLVLATFLARVPGVQILITSRVPVRIRAEHQYPVPPLSLPGPDTDVAGRLAEVGATAAVAVFRARLAEVRPDFRLTADNAATVVEICRRLDGVPLALELAAARGALLEPADLLRRLDHQLRLLTSGSADRPDRQRTLRAAIDWSYDLLDAEQRSLFSVLGAFAGEFDVAAALAAAGADPDEDAALDALGALVDSSMVRRLSRGDGTRFVLLAPMREYAVERLEASGASPAVQLRVLHHLVDELEARRPGFDGSEASRLLAITEDDYVTLRAALAWGLEAGHRDVAARLAVALSPHWFASGRLGEGREWLDRVLAGAPVAAAARVHLEAGALAYFQDAADAARRHLETCVELAGDADPMTRAVALGYLGAVALGDGDESAAAATAGQALLESRAGNSYEGQAVALSLSAVLAAVSGDLDREEALYRERLELVGARGDRRRIAETLNNLAELALATDRVDQARSYATQALDLARNSTKTVTRDLLLCLARIALADDDVDMAAGRAAEAAALSVQLGQQFEVAQCLLVLAGIAAQRGDAGRAARLYGCAARLRRETSPLAVELEPDIAAQRESVQRSLGTDAFHAAYVSGSAMTVQEALELALASGRDRTG